MITCKCGSSEFVVEYQTSARLTLQAGEPVMITYGPINSSGLFSTVTCVGCQTRLDLDNTLTGAHPEETLPFVATRYRADQLATDLPSVSVRARPTPPMPLAQPGAAPRSHRSDEAP